MDPKFINTTQIHDLIGGMKIVFLDERDTVQETMQKLIENKIWAAPVVSANGTVNRSLDMLDLVAYTTLKNIDPLSTTTKSTHKQVQEYFHHRIKGLTGLSRRNQWITATPEKNFRFLLQLFNRLTHRVWVRHQGGIIGVVTPMMILRLLNEHKDELKEEMSRKVSEIWPEKHLPSTVNHNERLMNAFHTIYYSSVSGLAVVDEHGKIVGNISASDLKFMEFTKPELFFDQLLLPIKEFFQLKVAVGTLSKNISLSPVIVKEEDTLEIVISKCLQERVHRVYVVDEAQKPLRVVSLTDVIEYFKDFSQSIEVL
jgi:CBS domain-containing protein